VQHCDAHPDREKEYMDLTDPAEKPLERVTALLRRYADPAASTAQLLCDRHDASSVAYSVVAQDLSADDLTYGALREDSARFAHALASLGLQRGDRVATLMGKSRAYLVTVMAIWRLGAVHVPLFTAFAPAAIALRALAAHCRIIVCDPAQRPKLAPSDTMPANPPWQVLTTGSADDSAMSYADLLAGSRVGFPAAAVGGDAPIIQIYTSGTTGTPKGVLVPLRAVAGFQAYAEYGLGLRAEDIFWNGADPGWAYGLYFGIIAALATGVRGILLEGGFSPELTFEVLARYAVTNFTAAPTVYRSLRAVGPASQRRLQLRCASSAGEPLTPEVNDWACRALNVPVHDHYGQTEMGMLINNHQHPALRRPLKPGSMGHALPGWHAVVLKWNEDVPAAVGETGRVAIDLSRSPLAWFSGYVSDNTRSAEKFSADQRWYLTGDTGTTDTEGYFYFCARDDDVIIMAGYRIGPSEVESVLMTHAAISECAVVAGPDELRGEVIEAFVVLRPGDQPSEELTSELQRWVKQRYAAHAYPRTIHYVEKLPRTPSGKVQRFVLRRQLRELISSSGNSSCA
jgi:acetyl-CoA synthetase